MGDLIEQTTLVIYLNKNSNSSFKFKFSVFINQLPTLGSKMVMDEGWTVVR